MPEALDWLCARAEHAVNSGFNIIIFSDRMTGADRLPIPRSSRRRGASSSYLEGARTSVGLVVETGDAREVHDSGRWRAMERKQSIRYLAFEILAAMASGVPMKLMRKKCASVRH